MAAAPIGMAAGLAGGIIGALGSGPSSAMIALNNQVQDFNKYMTAQAKTEGIDATSTFQNLMLPLQRIVSGGPNQAGWSNAQVNNWNASMVQRGAAAARDEGAFANNNPGSQTAASLAAKQKAEEGVSAGIAQGEQASAEAGRQEFNTAVGEEKGLPGVFSTSNAANEHAANEQQKAETSQQNIDTAKRSASWQGILSKSLSAAGGSASTGSPISAIGSGINNMSSDSGPLENLRNFASGGANGGKGTMPSSATGGVNGIGMSQSEE